MFLEPLEPLEPLLQALSSIRFSFLLQERLREPLNKVVLEAKLI
jgi:hypothetical protein